ncbi:MAG: prolyl oligopeptidase family serine peptidase [Oscillospiraceae bacterium]|nr:prolyl oligopeptidase family serine peptidase [Oscillospiraceae bacterium]
MSEIELRICSTLDGTMQPSLFYPASKRGRPLLVGLHTWSYDRHNQVARLTPVAERLDFNLLLPEFRGPNLQSNPDCRKACGSEFAKQDIKDAIDHVVREQGADAENVFLLGTSGGGHMALLMAGFLPEYFKAVAAVVPITDLREWAAGSEKYRAKILACCGGSEREMAARSPITYLDTIARANVKIFHGKFDRTVPVAQSLEFYRRMMQTHPDARVFLDIFDGGHEIDMTTAVHWLLTQYKSAEVAEVTG